MRRLLLIAFLGVAPGARADLSARPQPRCTGAVFSTHPGGWAEQVIWLAVTVRDAGSCPLTAALDDRPLDITPTASGFTSTLIPPLREGAHLRVGCGAALRDTGIVFRRSQLQSAGW